MSKVIGMRLLTTAVLEWFGDGCCDVKYLDLWNDTPRTYAPDQTDDSNWQIDHYETLLSTNCDQKQFQKAADFLMRYRVYPSSVLTALGDFNLAQERWMAVGDRIVQRFHIIHLLGKAVLDVIGMAEVRQVITDPRCHGFRCVTVAPHVIQGEWSARVIWRDNDDLFLEIDATSRPSPQEPARNHAFIRRLLQKTHQAGVAYFQQLFHR
jgi:hypothetical protein